MNLYIQMLAFVKVSFSEFNSFLVILFLFVVNYSSWKYKYTWGRKKWMSIDGQGTKRRRKIAENFNLLRRRLATFEHRTRYISTTPLLNISDGHQTATSTTI